MYLLHRREQFRMTSYSINVREIKRNQICTENVCTNWTYTPDMINISMFDKKKIIQNFSAMVRDMLLFRHTVSAMPRLIFIFNCWIRNSCAKQGAHQRQTGDKSPPSWAH